MKRKRKIQVCDKLLIVETREKKFEKEFKKVYNTIKPNHWITKIAESIMY